MDDVKGPDVLKETVEILEDHTIPYWLDYGTLLGIYRQSELIQWDHDIDLGVSSEYMKAILRLEQLFLNRGFEIFLMGSELKLKKDGVSLGISFYKFREDKAYYLMRLGERTFPKKVNKMIMYVLSIPNNADLDQRYNSFFIKSGIRIITAITKIIPYKIRRKLVEYLFTKDKMYHEYKTYDLKHYRELDTISAYHTDFKIPSHTEEFLQQVYGADWRLPKKDWKFERDFGGELNG